MEKTALRDQLLSHSEVPPYSHLPTEQGVFVFAALEHACAQALQQAPDTPVRRLLMKFLPKAYLSPETAVSRWGVRPSNLCFASLGGTEGRQVIYHTVFDAVLAYDVNSDKDGMRVMVDIFCGHPITPTGSVDFWFDGQPFRWAFPLPTPDDLKLPVLPDNAQKSLITQYVIPPAVQSVVARKDIQRAMIEQSEIIARVHTGYLAAGSRMMPDDWAHITPELLAKVDARISSIDLPLEPDPILSKTAQNHVDYIRQLRPELTNLCGATLHRLFMQQDAMEKECLSRGFPLSQEGRVLALCLGYAARGHLPPDFASSHVLITGVWVMAFLRYGHSLASALEHAARCQLWYQQTYWKLHRFMMVMGYTNGIQNEPRMRLAGPGVRLYGSEGTFDA